jgi:hypothetical protein
MPSDNEGSDKDKTPGSDKDKDGGKDKDSDKPTSSGGQKGPKGTKRSASRTPRPPVEPRTCKRRRGEKDHESFQEEGTGPATGLNPPSAASAGTGSQGVGAVVLRRRPQAEQATMKR